MRSPIVIVALLAVPPAIAIANPAPDRREGPPSRHADSDPVLVREPDGSIVIRRTLPALPAGLDAAAFPTPDSDRVAPSPLGRRRSPSEQAVDEDLERAFEQAAEMARFGAPD